MESSEVGIWYPIGAVARKTGISVHTLRAWERRHEVVTPRRSAGGTRLYSNLDIEKLRLLRRLTEDGHSIGQVAGLPREALRELLRAAAAEDRPTPTLTGATAPPAFVREILSAVEVMDGPRIHRSLMQAVRALTPTEVVERVVLPVLREVGDRWAAGSICPAHEHLLSVNVRRVLAWLTEAPTVEEDAPVMLATTPAEQWHELGAQIAGALAANAGWRVVFLGPNLPARDVARAVDITGARAVALGITIVQSRTLLEELRELRAALPMETAIVVGGRAAELMGDTLEEAGMLVAPTYGALMEMLERLAPVGAAG